MEGAALAAKRQFDIAITAAWHTEAFARTKKMPKLADLLREKPRSRSTFADAHAFFGRLKAKGAPITIN